MTHTKTEDVHGVGDSAIRRISIIGLHKDRDVVIDFRENIKIILSENGSGKTTTLNLLASVLSLRPSRIKKIAFDSIDVVFSSGVTLELSPKDVQNMNYGIPTGDDQIYRSLSSVISETQFEELFAISGESSVEAVMSSRVFKEIDSIYLGPSRELATWAIDQARGRRLSEEEKARADDIKAKIRENFPYQVIYLPTYRRIEEDIRSLGLETQSLSRRIHRSVQRTPESLINFGMTDVENQIDNITEDIRGASIRWYQTITGQMLNELASPKEKNRTQLTYLWKERLYNSYWPD